MCWTGASSCGAGFHSDEGENLILPSLTHIFRHFILRGPPDTPYHGGEYWGQLLFPPEYPFKPP